MNSHEKLASISREEQLRVWKEKKKEQKQILEYTSTERRKRSTPSDVSIELSTTRSLARRTAQNTPFSDGSGKLNSVHSFQQETVAFRLKVQGKNVKDSVTTRSITPHPRSRIRTQRDSVTASVGSESSRDGRDFKIPPLPDQRSRKHIQTRRNRRPPKVLSVKARLENISPLSTSFFSPPTYHPSQSGRSSVLQGNMSLKADSFKTPTETRAIRQADLPTTSSKRADSIANQTENTEDRLSRQFSTNVLIGRGRKATKDHDWRLMTSPDPSDFNTPIGPKDELQSIGGDELVHRSEDKSPDSVDPFTESEDVFPPEIKTESELEGEPPSQLSSTVEVRCGDPFIESEDIILCSETNTESKLEGVSHSQPSSTIEARCTTAKAETSIPPNCLELLAAVECEKGNELLRSCLDSECCSESQSTSDMDPLKFDMDEESLHVTTSRRFQHKKSRRQSMVYGSLPTDEGVERKLYSPASSEEENDNDPLPSGIHAAAAQTPSTSYTGCLLACDNMEKVDGKTVLEPVAETTDISCVPCTLCGDTNEIQLLRVQLGELLVSNQKLLTGQHKFREDYEKRVTPFRDLFEDAVKLRTANKKLKAENDTVNATLQSTISNLQKQMSEALSIALSKKNELETKLKNAEATISQLTNSKETEFDEDLFIKGSDL